MYRKTVPEMSCYVSRASLSSCSLTYLLVSDVAVFVLKRDVKLQPTNQLAHLLYSFQKRSFGNKLHKFVLRAEYPSCYPTSSVKALKGAQSTDPNQWPGLILFFIHNRASEGTGCCSFDTVSMMPVTYIHSWLSIAAFLSSRELVFTTGENAFHSCRELVNS